MKQVIKAGQRSGQVKALASKSQAHRQLICAALSKQPSVILCEGMSKDIEATIACLNGLGADITVEADRISVVPVDYDQSNAGKAVDPTNADGAGQICHLYCGESGSTLRFLLPVVGALGKDAVFHMEGRLPERPLGPFARQLCAHGMQLSQKDDLLYCSGQLENGAYTLPGNISSQYISGLLLALPLLAGDSVINITGTIESENYILMTEDAIKAAGIRIRKPVFSQSGTESGMQKQKKTDAERLSESKEVTRQYELPGGQTFCMPPLAETERDWSNATFFLCMGALSEKGVTVEGLSLDSSQGDKAVLEVMANFGAEVTISRATSTGIRVRKKNLTGCVIDAAKIPDMVPAISAVAAVADGVTQITHAERLRIKESDRLQTVCQMLSNLGAEITETEDGLLIKGKPMLEGGTVDAANDHRIAMAAAVAACTCTGEVLVEGAECVSKSYPGFWEDFDKLES